MNDTLIDEKRDLKISRFFRQIWVPIFVLIILLIISFGYWFYQNETERIYKNKYSELSTIAALKAREIIQWRNERLADADRLGNSPLLAKAIAGFVNNPDSIDRRTELQQHLKIERIGDMYADVQLLDPEGRLLLSATDKPDTIESATQNAVRIALANRQPVISEFYIPTDGKVQLDTIAPIWEADGRPVAVVILSTHAENYLYPLIRSWPTPIA